MNFRNQTLPLLCLLFTSATSWAQVSGRLSGTVTDPTGQVIVAADVTITNMGTSEQRMVQSNEAGNFGFAALPPSTYTLNVQSPGFQAYEQVGIVINANQALAVGNVPLAIGAVTETVTVEAEGAAVETDTAGVNAMLTSNQMDGLMQRGRDIVALLTVLPGVSQTAGSDALGGNWGTRTPNFSGARAGWNNFMLDGMPGNDIDATASFHVSVSMDAIQEVSVKMTAYQAEYGRTPGGQVNIISKSGTNEFHGSAYWFKRNEALNANSFDNNRFGSAKPPYRFDTYGGVIGGPIKRDKAFFFVSQENWGIQKPSQRHRATVPTALERGGDFSQSVEQNGSLIPVIDHMTGSQFPNNMIPAARINRNGQGLLNFMPSPTDQGLFASQGINYTELSPSAHPKIQWQFKFDWVPTPNDRITFRPRFWNADIQAQRETVAFNAFNNSIFVQPHHYEYINKNLQGIYNKTLSPTLVNEFRLGLGLSRESGALNDEFQLTKLRRENNPGLEDLGQLFPSANPLGLIPRFNFGGIPNAPSSDYDPRTPIAAHDERPVLSNNMSWFKGNHSVKFGFYWEMNDASEGPRSGGVGRHMGTFNFRRTNLNPYDSNHPFANAILGNFFEYSESSGQTEGLARTYTAEWFVQDTWKVTPKFTLDVGVRFSSFTPWRLRENEGSALAIERIAVGSIPSLYYPTIDAGGNRVAYDAATGEHFPAPYIGANIPGRGDRLNGVIIGDGEQDYLHGYRERPPIQVQPRLGFAYDPFGKGKTAVRGSFAVQTQAIFGSQGSMWDVTTSPPILESPTIYFGNLDTFLNAGQVFFPPNMKSFDPKFDPPRIYQWNLGVQQDIGNGTVVDVSYVGNSGTNLYQTRNLNTIAPGIRFDDTYRDRTTDRPLPDVFLRPYYGYQGINLQENTGWSNYNALQVSVNRRYTSSFQYGIAYTWSKAMGLGNGDRDALPIYRSARGYLYGKTGFDQTHMFVANYLWSLPNARIFADNPAGRALFHNWEVAGIITMASGFPRGVGFSYTDGVDRWGGGDSPRANMVANPVISSKSFERWFNTESVAAPGFGDYGNAPRDVFRGPGINSWDFTLYKNIPVTESSRFQFRWEMYNMFNHTQYNGVDSNARFDASGAQINGNFGRVTSARQPRVMQVSIRFEF